MMEKILERCTDFRYRAYLLFFSLFFPTSRAHTHTNTHTCTYIHIYTGTHTLTFSTIECIMQHHLAINSIENGWGGGREALVAIISTAVGSRLGTTLSLGDLTLFRDILEKGREINQVL